MRSVKFFLYLWFFESYILPLNDYIQLQAQKLKETVSVIPSEKYISVTVNKIKIKINKKSKERTSKYCSKLQKRKIFKERKTYNFL